MKRKKFKKFLLVSLCCGLLAVSCFGLLGCGSNSNNLEEKCKIVFDYLSKREIQFYQIDELTACNKNINNDHKNYFDGGEIYKITVYNQSGSNVSFQEYFFGKLDGKPVLYLLDKMTYYNLVKIDI